eukprot:jgi/Mesvir1/23744/Mv18682-RA.1
MISQFFVLSLRGDIIIYRDYRGDVPKSSPEVFFRKVKFWKGDGEEAPPIFNVDGVSYAYIKTSGLFLVTTTRSNLSPGMLLSFMHRISCVAKDYCGTLSEDALRQNFVLVYELLDEIVDFGYPQGTATEALRAYVFNEPVVVDQPRLPPGAASLFAVAKRMPSSAITKSVIPSDSSGKSREEIFVDVIENLSVTFNSAGYILQSEIDGTIQMKSYLSSNPDVRLALNEDLAVGRYGGTHNAQYGGSGMGVFLDDANFHESVRMDEFEAERTLTLTPPTGEFSVMNYRMTREFAVPFRLYPHVEEAGPFKLEVLVKLIAEFPANLAGVNVVVRIPVPPSTQRVGCELNAGAAGQAHEYKEAAKMVEWTFKKVTGGSEHLLRMKLTVAQQDTSGMRKEYSGLCWLSRGWGSAAFTSQVIMW